MRLFQTDEFEEAVTQAHSHFAGKGRDLSEQCDRLCFGVVPAWAQVAQTFEELRPLL
jgi:hypothetical protein